MSRASSHTNCHTTWMPLYQLLQDAIRGSAAWANLKSPSEHVAKSGSGQAKPVSRWQQMALSIQCSLISPDGAMASFQDRVRELKGFLGKLLPRAASLRSRRSLNVPEAEVSAWPAFPSSVSQ